MIVSGIIATSQMGTYNIIPHVKMQKSMYTDEGVLNRIHWLLVVERSKYPDTDFLKFKYSDYSFDHFLPDGVVHKIDYHGTPVALRLTGTAFAKVDEKIFEKYYFRMVLEKIQRV